MRSRAALASLAVALCACGSAPARCTGRACGPWAWMLPRMRSLVLPCGRLTGLSGLAVDARGTGWAVAEHQHGLFHFGVSRGGVTALGTVRLEGVEDGVDTESIAWLEDARFAIGTEREVAQGDGDDVLVVRVDGRRASVAERIHLSYDSWGMNPVGNTGIEGLCAAGGQLLAAVEQSEEEGGRRYAPIGRYDLSSRRWTAFRLRLGSATGNVSSLECRVDPADPSKLEALAIERHFGVARILRFTIPREGAGADVTPAMVLDLTGAFRRVPNFEGIAWLPDGTVLLVNDNDYRGIDGPTRLFVLPAGTTGRPGSVP